MLDKLLQLVLLGQGLGERVLAFALNLPILHLCQSFWIYGNCLLSGKLLVVRDFSEDGRADRITCVVGFLLIGSAGLYACDFS